MIQSTRGQTLLEELDERQNEVLRRLDDLDARIQSLILECTASRRGGSVEAE
jgi:hypothetical protein